MRAADLALGLLALLAAAPARAAEPCRKTSEAAEALFARGRAELDAGHLDSACALLAESEEAEPGVGTLGLLAVCHEKQGRLATAQRELEETAQRAHACHDDREPFARERADALAPRVPRLRITARDRDVVIEARREDGEPLSIPLDAEVPVDPGTLVIDARAPGRTSFRATVIAVPGALALVDIPALLSSAPPVALAPAPRRPRPPRPAPPYAYLGVAGGLAVLGLAASIGGGVVALDRKADSARFCDAEGRCLPEGGALREQGRTAATIATAGAGVAVFGLLTSGLALLPPRAPASAAVTLAPGACSAALTVHF